MSSKESSDAPDEELLYQSKRVKVTPSWLIIKNTSYAVRYMQKLTYLESKPPRIAAGIIFVLFLVLTLLQVLRIREQPDSSTLGWILLALCLLVLMISSFVAFAMSASYTVVVVLASEAAPLTISPPTKTEAKKLHEALSQAMDFYQSNPEMPAAIQDKVGESA